MSVTRGSKHRYVSQATLRSFTGKSAGEKKDILDALADLQPVKQDRPREIKFEFQTGRQYVIGDKKLNGYIVEHILIYQGKQGKHHVFKHWTAGWIITFTDQQLIGKHIQEVNQ